MYPGLYLRGRIWWFRWSHDGKRTFKSLETDDLQEALKQAEEIRERPTLEPGGKWSSVVKVYIKDARARGILSETFAPNREGALTAEGMRMDWRGVDMVTAQMLQEWFDDLRRRRCDSTALTYLTHVRSFLNWCVANGKLRKNPAAEVDRERVSYKARVNFASAETARMLIDKCERRDLERALMLGFLCGLRRREIMHTREEWLEANNLRVRAGWGFRPKWGRERLVPIPRELAQSLRRSPIPGIDKFGPYLVGPGDAPWDFKRPWLDHLAACEVSGLTIHDMRRTFASLKVSAGVPLYKVAKWLGISITVAEKNYAHLAPDTSGDVERGLP